MQVKNIPLYLTFGFMGLLVLGFAGLYLYHKSYARESYDIAECSKKYQFVNMTIPRTVRYVTSAFVNPEAFHLTTIFYLYSVREYRAPHSKDLFNTLIANVTDDPEEFLHYEEKNDDDAVVFLKKIPSLKTGKEPMYCVSNTEDALALHQANNPNIFFGVQSKRVKNFFPPLEPAQRVILSWGPVRR